MTAAMELLHPAPFLLFLLFLLTRPGVTSADNNGPVKVKVKEGDDVVLPCSHGQTDLTYKLFDWKKDDQQEVFLYDSGIHYNNGRGGQDPQFKGRVSHFEDELHRGNASIKIRNTKLEDRGKYKCIFPRLRNQIFHIELVVGAVPKPSVATVEQTADRALLQCSVKGAFPEPTVEWKNSAGKVLPSVVTHDSEVNDRFDITLQTNVTQTGYYSCVVTQDDIGHQVYSEIFEWFGPVKVKVTEGYDVVLPCSHGQTDLNYQIFDWTKDDQQEVFLYNAGIHYNNGLKGQDPQFKGRVSHFEDELQRGNASIKIRNTNWEDSGKYKCIFPHLENQIFHIELAVGPVKVKVKEGDDVVLPCSLRETDLTYLLFDWTKVEDDEDKTQKEVFLYDGGDHYNNKGRTGQDPQFKDRVSHFEDELQRGNASIKIRNTKLEDRGKYKCIFPNLGNQIFHIELVVDPVLKKRNTKGASPEPYVKILDQTKDWSQLQCAVRGASPKPTVEWRDSSGNIVPAEEPQVTERGGSYDIILQTTVTKTDNYRCVATQDEINHQVHAETHVSISGDNSGLIAGWTVAAVFFVLFMAILGYVVYIKCSTKQEISGGYGAPLEQKPESS